MKPCEAPEKRPSVIRATDPAKPAPRILDEVSPYALMGFEARSPGREPAPREPVYELVKRVSATKTPGPTRTLDETVPY